MSDVNSYYKDNPFYKNWNGHMAGAIDAQSRIEMVKQFNREQCEAALKVLGLQKSVEKAVNSRLKKLTTKHDAVNQTA